MNYLYIQENLLLQIIEEKKIIIFEMLFIITNKTYVVITRALSNNTLSDKNNQLSWW